MLLNLFTFSYLNFYLGVTESHTRTYFFQKQPPRSVFRRRCSENMQQIYRTIPIPKWLCNFIEIVLRHGCSPVNLLHIFRRTFLKNTFGRLLLFFVRFFSQKTDISMWQIHYFSPYENKKISQWLIIIVSRISIWSRETTINRWLIIGGLGRVFYRFCFLHSETVRSIPLYNLY